ncbi:hypothetical protein JSY14_09615 [Brachybacterium sp. EF45031]|uniref:hypothetical protein n=1 Tax=Brachybacterium sillae TaxID=2810536 RepID=UPI00217D04FC|nr:hypothetical protein [Brachybacterium sillae]MCS6712262.1 hypothetical protein [Brachybacterium sillae]
MPQRRRRLALAAAALSLALAGTGCSYLNPVQTHEFYQAADGTNEQLGPVGVRNAVVVVDESGAGQFSTTLVNDSSEDASVELTGLADGSDAFSHTVTVPAGGTVRLGSGEGAEQVPVSNLAVPAGAMMELRVRAGDQETTMSLPVLDQTLEYYKSASDGGQ